MEQGNQNRSLEHSFEEEREERTRPRDLPADLPRSLNDRRSFTPLADETEMYDAWQGMQY